MSLTVNVNFNDFIDAASPFSEIRSSRTKVADAEKDQIDFKSKLSDIGMRGKNQTNRGVKRKILRVFMICKSSTYKVKHIY